MKLLFICSANALRSPTAEAIFSRCKDIEASSAGTNHDAETPISSDLIEWADLVFVMENTHSRTLQKRFGASLNAKRVVVLGIPDKFKFMDQDLIRILKAKVEPYLPIAAP
jgi:predicted protein tyrosine phosphatase